LVFLIHTELRCTVSHTSDLLCSLLLCFCNYSDLPQEVNKYAFLLHYISLCRRIFGEIRRPAFLKCCFDWNMLFWIKYVILTEMCCFDWNMLFWIKYVNLTEMCCFDWNIKGTEVGVGTKWTLTHLLNLKSCRCFVLRAERISQYAKRTAKIWSQEKFGLVRRAWSQTHCSYRKLEIARFALWTFRNRILFETTSPQHRNLLLSSLIIGYLN